MAKRTIVCSSTLDEQAAAGFCNLLIEVGRMSSTGTFSGF